MEKQMFLAFFALFFISFAYAETTIDYYYGEGCPHCKVVADSGILEKLNESFSVTKYETWYNVQNGNKFRDFLVGYGVPRQDQGVPFLVINCSDKLTYLVGDQPIIDSAESLATNCDFEPLSVKKTPNNYLFWILGILVVIVVGWFLIKKK